MQKADITVRPTYVCRYVAQSSVCTPRRVVNWLRDSRPLGGRRNIRVSYSVTTAADDINKYFFIVFRENQTWCLVNPLLGRGVT